MSKMHSNLCISFPKKRGMIIKLPVLVVYNTSSVCFHFLNFAFGFFHSEFVNIVSHWNFDLLNIGLTQTTVMISRTYFFFLFQNILEMKYGSQFL